MIAAPVVTIERFNRLDYPLAWGWIMQDRNANLDDYGPITCRDFIRTMQQRERTELIMGARAEEAPPIGIMAALPISPDNRLWTLHGICFDKSVHGTGIPLEAVRQFLDVIWSRGAQKICASFFSDNVRVFRFLQKLGALEEGFRRAQSIRNGKPISMYDVAFFKEGA